MTTLSEDRDAQLMMLMKAHRELSDKVGEEGHELLGVVGIDTDEQGIHLTDEFWRRFSPKGTRESFHESYKEESGGFMGDIMYTLHTYTNYTFALQAAKVGDSYDGWDKGLEEEN